MNKYEKFCIEEAAFYMDKARDILTEEMKDPKKYYDEMIDTYKHLTKMFPFIIFTRFTEPGSVQYTEPPQNRPSPEESLSDTQSSDQSSEDNYDTVSQPSHLRF
jgi:hypothetical protein